MKCTTPWISKTRKSKFLETDARTFASVWWLNGFGFTRYFRNRTGTGFLKFLGTGTTVPIPVPGNFWYRRSLFVTLLCRRLRERLFNDPRLYRDIRYILTFHDLVELPVLVYFRHSFHPHSVLYGVWIILQQLIYYF